MRPKEQEKLVFNNKCKCVVDYNLLEKAMIWYAKNTLKKHRVIYMYGEYAAVSIYNEKIHIHRLLKMYVDKTIYPSYIHVHHINGDKLNNSIDNLTLVLDTHHASSHNKGKTLSKEHKQKIGENNKLRKGTRYKYRRTDITPKMVYDLKEEGLSFTAISKIYRIEWATARQRYYDAIHDNKDLIE